MPSDWERVSADPALLAALRRHYAGSGDPVDQLWWAEHPGLPTPSGTGDPAERVEAARRALFQRGSTEAMAHDVERAATAVAADRDSARRALQAADRAVPPSRDSTPVASGSGPSRRVLAGATVAALLVGAGAGFATGRFTTTTSPAALEVFSRAQTAADRPPSDSDMPSFVARTSTRYLGGSTTTGVAVYGARARDGRVCLLAIVLAARFTASCTSPAGFAASGLSLSLEATVDPQNDSGVATLQEIDPYWSPTGGLRF